MTARVHPSYRRKRIWPFVVYYTLIPPRINSVDFHAFGYTHNFFTGRNTFTVHDIGSVTWGDEHRPQRRRGRR